MKRDWNSLPDDILLRILSFLTAKQAVQSTYISKRWLNLWTFLPNLNFNYDDCRNVSCFDKFVDNVVTLRDQSASIESLTFIRRGRPKHEFLGRVMSYAATHGVQHLTIYIEILHSLCWLCPIDSLLTLNLRKSWNNNNYFYPTQDTCFTQLVTLHIEHATLVKSDAFSGCPNLKNLTLIKCLVDPSLKVLILSSTRLSKLTIEISEFACGQRVVLLTSRLTFLKIEGLYPLEMLFQSNDGSPQFNEIYFDSEKTEGLSNERKQKLHSYLTKMLRSLHKAKYVTVSATTLEILGYAPETLAREEYPFLNLKSLTLIPSYSRRHKSFKLPACVMDYFIRSSPQAQVNIQFPRGMIC